LTAKQLIQITEQLTEITKTEDSISICNKEGKHRVTFNLLKYNESHNLVVTGDYGKHIYGFYGESEHITFESIASITPKELNDKCEASMTGARPTEWRADIALLTCMDKLKENDTWDKFIELGGPDALKLPTTWGKWLRCPKGTDIKKLGETEIEKLDDKINFSLFFDIKDDLNIFFQFNTTSYRTEIHLTALRIALGMNIDDIPILRYSKYEVEFMKIVEERKKKLIEEAKNKKLVTENDEEIIDAELVE